MIGKLENFPTQLYTGTEKTFELRKGVSPASYYYFRVKVSYHTHFDSAGILKTCFYGFWVKKRGFM